MTAVDRARQAAASVLDPELRVLTIGELGILRDVRVTDEGTAVVTITPTYVGCPAVDAIRADVVSTVRNAGFASVEVITSWSPGWSTEWLDDRSRAKLRAAGIAPPGPVPEASRFADVPAHRRLPLLRTRPACPRCGSTDTSELSRFGSTACRALWHCARCREPFDFFKEH